MGGVACEFCCTCPASELSARMCQPGPIKKRPRGALLDRFKLSAQPTINPARETFASRLERARDHQFHDLVRPAIDPLDANVAEHAADLIFVHEAIAAEELQAAINHLVQTV